MFTWTGVFEPEFKKTDPLRVITSDHLENPYAPGNSLVAHGHLGHPHTEGPRTDVCGRSSRKDKTGVIDDPIP